MNQKEESCCCGLITINKEIDDLRHDVFSIIESLEYKYPELYTEGEFKWSGFPEIKDIIKIEQLYNKDNELYYKLKYSYSKFGQLTGLERALHYMSECCGEKTTNKCAEKIGENETLTDNVFDAGIVHGNKPRMYITKEPIKDYIFKKE